MAKRIPVETVTVLRGGKRVTPKLGVPFDFTTDEISEIVGTADKPGLRPQALKKVLAEDADEDLVVEEAAPGPAARGDADSQAVEAAPAAEVDDKPVGEPAPGAKRGKQHKPADDDDDL